MTENVPACPECDSCHTERRTDGNSAPAVTGWYCKECKERFDQPNWREPNANTVSANAVLEAAIKRATDE